MRRERYLAPMICLLLLLSACGQDPADEWQRWQAELSAAPAVSFTAEIVSSGETDALRFTAEIEGDAESVTMTLLAPETLQGLQIVTRREGRELRVEDMRLSLTAGRREVLSPSEAGAILLAAAREGALLSAGRDGEALRASFTGPREETVTLWRGADGSPFSAELGREGKTELRMTITHWQTGE